MVTRLQLFPCCAAGGANASAPPDSAWAIALLGAVIIDNYTEAVAGVKHTRPEGYILRKKARLLMKGANKAWYRGSKEEHDRLWEEGQVFGGTDTAQSSATPQGEYGFRNVSRV